MTQTIHAGTGKQPWRQHSAADSRGCQLPTLDKGAYERGRRLVGPLEPGVPS